MDELANFLPRAQWVQRGQYTWICKDPNLNPIMERFKAQLPDRFRSGQLHAWKTLGNTKVMQTVAYVIPVSIIEGSARILKNAEDCEELLPGSEPIHFENDVVISGNLYYVLAYPTGP
ncbi:hypothetical protein BJX63DRAFT_390409 [Aspergillus granulosus]|uniref:Uncharacterized protein n=1 Tax=Aspergillus granulosus TaxID=176169 RepID=A0ABR4HIS4_9EURO